MDDETEPIISRETPRGLQQTVRRQRIVKTVAMFFIWVPMGLFLSSHVVSLVDLTELLGVNYAQITRAIVSRNVGLLAGSLLGGLAADLFAGRVDALLGAESVLFGLAHAAVPWCPSLPLMALAFFLEGAGQGALSAAGNAHCMALWGDDAARPLFTLHLGYNLGTVLGAPLMAPFLSGSVHHNGTHGWGEVETQEPVASHIPEYISNVALSTTHGYAFLNDWEHKVHNATGNMTATSIQIPYAITGCVSLLSGVTFFLLLCFGLPSSMLLANYNAAKEVKNASTSDSSKNDAVVPSGSIQDNTTDDHRNHPLPTGETTSSDCRPSKLQHLKTVLSPGSCTGGDVGFGAKYFTLLFLFYIFFIGAGCYLTFLVPVAISRSLGLSKQTASVVVMASSLAGIGGRLVSLLAAKLVPLRTMLLLEVLTILAAQVCLTLWGLDSVVIFWVTNCVFGLANAPIFPSVIAWGDRYVKMTAVAIGVINIASGTSSFAFNWISGYLLQYKGPEYMMYVITASAGVALIVMVCMQVLLGLRGERFDRERVAEVTSEEREPTTS